MATRFMHPFVATAAMAVGLVVVLTGSTARAQYGQYLPPNHINPHGLSQGGQNWWFGPNLSGAPAHLAIPKSTGSPGNVDAANPNEDLAPGQSETAIAASGKLVMSAWNDASNFFVSPSTDPLASATGVGFSRDGGHAFKDLVGLPNNNPNQKWEGDPSVVAIDGGKFFIVSSLYLAISFNCASGPAQNAIAVSVATITPTGVQFTNPIVVASGGDACSTGQTAFLDKDFMSYDPKTRTLAVTYDRFSFFGFGTGQPEVVTASIPVSPPFLSSADFSAPIVIWPEEASYENEGAYPALAYNPSTGADDIYVAWERNWFTNQFNGDPYVYIQAAVIPMGATTPLLGGPNAPIIVTLNQANSNVNGGVKSLDLVPVTGYNRGTSNDFPRLAWDGASDRILFVWNDASHHPLGDIFMRAYGSRFSSTGPIEKVNDDNTGALHMFPAVCVRTDGSIVTSWYDRRNYTPGSGLTDYYGEIRTSPATNGTDFKITNAPSNWVNDSSIIIPNFGDYTDNSCDGTNTFYTWSDGRLGIPQPFVAHN
jgi:hypothetical protein